jgi:hypothetical protein
MLGSKYGLPPELTETALNVGENLLGRVAGEKQPEEQQEYEEQRDPGPAYYLRNRRT